MKNKDLNYVEAFQAMRDGHKKTEIAEDESPDNIETFKCDRCGKLVNFSWDGGVCEMCGDNLCGACANWSEEDNFEYCERCRKAQSDEPSRCPFCAYMDIRLGEYAYRNQEGNISWLWKIYCNNCKVEKLGFRTKQEAIKWWNTRGEQE